jgi:hypothetical protein
LYGRWRETLQHDSSNYLDLLAAEIHHLNLMLPGRNTLQHGSAKLVGRYLDGSASSHRRARRAPKISSVPS